MSTPRKGTLPALFAAMRAAQEGRGASAGHDASSRRGASLRSTSVSPPPTLPPEILAHIGTFSKSGTKLLLEFALASRNMYELLVPHLHRVFLPRMDVIPAEKRRRIASIWEEKGLFHHVRHLHLETWSYENDSIDLGTILSKGLPNKLASVQLRFDESGCLYRFAGAAIPHLASLDLCFAPTDWLDSMPDLRFDFPFLRELTLREFVPHQLISELGPESCPKLQTFKLEVGQDRVHPTLGPFLLSKLKSWTGFSEEDLRVLLADPLFSPERLVLDDDGDWDQASPSRETWSAIMKLPSLDIVRVPALDVALLADFPPGWNVRLLAVGELHLRPLDLFRAVRVQRVLLCPYLIVRVEIGFIEQLEDEFFDGPTAEEASELLDLVGLLESRGAYFESWVAEDVEKLKEIASTPQGL